MAISVLAGCAKNTVVDGQEDPEEKKTTWITTEEFADACEKMGLEELEPGETPEDTKTVENGYYIVADEKYVRRNRDEISEQLKNSGVLSVIDADDIESYATAVKCDGFDDLSDIQMLYDLRDIGDIELEGAFALQMSLEDNYTKDIMDYLEDELDDYGIDVKDLSEEEYYSSKEEGYLRLHIDIKDLFEAASESDDLKDLLESLYYDTDVFDDLAESMSGDIAVSIEINSSNLFIIGGISVNKEAKQITTFANKFDCAADPMDLPENSDITGAAVDAVADKIKSYVEAARAAAESVLEHNEAIESVNQEIEDVLNGI